MFFLFCFFSAPIRLLKVKPEERLTIEEVLAHPWLNCTEALDNVLPSAQMMMDKVSFPLFTSPKKHIFYSRNLMQTSCSSSCLVPQRVTVVSGFQAVVAGIQQAHAEQLANMRIQDLNVSLKPLNSVNNPILRKRKLLGCCHLSYFHVSSVLRSLNILWCCCPDATWKMCDIYIRICNWFYWLCCRPKPSDSFFIHDPENGDEDSNVALEKLRDVIAQCILPQAGQSRSACLCCHTL